ncbi:hypothetical protein N7463_009369 [Penicillium fimorum]|uniref:Uncharacterized protein n=1 Tax=Penicillium fimorum TaxID=1882269 RepID=A0A9W9XQM8_9EURO|nr:hypothetical protein N7463_009369 [Penicillium fimorum]
MKTDKYIINCEIEEDDNIHDTEGNAEEEALEHHGHPQDEALQLDDKPEAEAYESREMSLNSTSSSDSPLPPTKQRVLPCQRCFVRMEGYTNHVCILRPGNLKCGHCLLDGRFCFDLPNVFRADATRALSTDDVRRRAALIRTISARVRQYERQHKRGKSTYGSSSTMDIDSTPTISSDTAAVPPCPRSYQTPMTNALRKQDTKTIEAVRGMIQTVLDRTTWEVEKLTEHLNELGAEREADERQEDLSAWL